MSDSDSDGSLSPKRRRFNDEAEEGEEEDVADEQEPEGENLDDSDDDDRMMSKKKKGRAANARDFIIDEAEVNLKSYLSWDCNIYCFRWTRMTRRERTPGSRTVMMTSTVLTRPMWRVRQRLRSRPG